MLKEFTLEFILLLKFKTHSFPDIYLYEVYLCCNVYYSQFNFFPSTLDTPCIN